MSLAIIPFSVLRQYFSQSTKQYFSVTSWNEAQESCERNFSSSCELAYSFSSFQGISVDGRPTASTLGLLMMLNDEEKFCLSTPKNSLR